MRGQRGIGVSAGVEIWATSYEAGDSFLALAEKQVGGGETGRGSGSVVATHGTASGGLS